MQKREERRSRKVTTHEELGRPQPAPGLEGSSLTQAQPWSSGGRLEELGCSAIQLASAGIKSSTRHSQQRRANHAFHPFGEERQVPLALTTREATAPIHRPGRFRDPPTSQPPETALHAYPSLSHPPGRLPPVRIDSLASITRLVLQPRPGVTGWGGARSC